MGRGHRARKPQAIQVAGYFCCAKSSEFTAGGRPPGSGTSILPIGGGDIPTGPWTAAPEEKTFLVEEI